MLRLNETTSSILSRFKNLFRVFENLFLVVHLYIIPNNNFLFFFTVKNLRLSTKNLFNYLINIQNVFRCKKFFFFVRVEDLSATNLFLATVFSHAISTLAII